MEEFEALLMEFKPRRPGPMPPPPKAPWALWVLGAAAVAALVVVVSHISPVRHAVVVGNFSPAGNPVPTIESLTQLALSDPAALDAVLDRMSRTLLPDAEQPNHALNALGRDAK